MQPDLVESPELAAEPSALHHLAVVPDPAAHPNPAANPDPAADHVGHARMAVPPAYPPAVGYSPKPAVVRGVSPVWIPPGSHGWLPISGDPAVVLAWPVVDPSANEIWIVESRCEQINCKKNSN